MRIIYIPVTKKIKEKNFKNFLICFLYDIYVVLKNFSFKRKITKNTSGYIDAAIHSNAFVLELPYNYCIIFSKILDYLFNLSKKFNIKKVIVDSTDKSINKIKDEILEGFDFVIKRENNKITSSKKYFTTILPCTLIDYKILKNKESINWNFIGHSKPNYNPSYDIFFSGQTTSPYRREIIDYLHSQDFNFFGRAENFKIPFKEYLSVMYNSSINLALEGKGEFTFRHLEILASCSFMICSSSINDLELPIPLIDGKHFVSFKNKEDLLEKINFYLKNKELREEIALNGRNILEKYYSPKKHGEILFGKIFS